MHKSYFPQICDVQLSWWIDKLIDKVENNEIIIVCNFLLNQRWYLLLFRYLLAIIQTQYFGSWKYFLKFFLLINQDVIDLLSKVFIFETIHIKTIEVKSKASNDSTS